MKRIKVSEASGIVLDWLVAKCEEVKTYGPADFRRQRREVVKDGEYMYRWSASWSQGGPIIEREGISTAVSARVGGEPTEWVASYSPPFQGGPSWHGPTPLVAAMRCYVAGKLGEEAEVPEELL